MKKQAVFILFLLLTALSIKAQEALPKFTVKELSKGKILISWVNPFANCNQLMVQRSYDSIRFFKSIYSAQSPALPQNGFVDNEAVPGIKTFYRIFYVLESGDYFLRKLPRPQSLNLLCKPKHLNLMFQAAIMITQKQKNQEKKKKHTPITRLP